MSNKMFSFLSLMKRARQLSSGDDTVEIDIKKGNVKLLIIAKDASDNTKKKFHNMAEYRKVPYVYFGTKEELGPCVGKAYTAVMAIKDQGFADSFLEKFKREYDGGDDIVKNQDI
jgi:ribosomal protein L7Ae-like RNA K-turn-binding protein